MYVPAVCANSTCTYALLVVMRSDHVVVMRFLDYAAAIISVSIIARCTNILVFYQIAAFRCGSAKS
jgi:hypothetical protein